MSGVANVSRSVATRETSSNCCLAGCRNGASVEFHNAHHVHVVARRSVSDRCLIGVRRALGRRSRGCARGLHLLACCPRAAGGGILKPGGGIALPSAGGRSVPYFGFPSSLCRLVVCHAESTEELTSPPSTLPEAADQQHATTTSASDTHIASAAVAEAAAAPAAITAAATDVTEVAQGPYFLDEGLQPTTDGATTIQTCFTLQFLKGVNQNSICGPSGSTLRTGQLWQSVQPAVQNAASNASISIDWTTWPSGTCSATTVNGCFPLTSATTCTTQQKMVDSTRNAFQRRADDICRLVRNGGVTTAVKWEVTVTCAPQTCTNSSSYSYTCPLNNASPRGWRPLDDYAEL
jgi:hypothetical protein